MASIVWIEGLQSQTDYIIGLCNLRSSVPTLYSLIIHSEHLCGITKMMGAGTTTWEFRGCAVIMSKYIIMG